MYIENLICMSKNIKNQMGGKIMKKILLLDAISFQVDPNDEIWRYENVAQIKYAAKRENSRIIV